MDEETKKKFREIILPEDSQWKRQIMWRSGIVVWLFVIVVCIMHNYK